MESKKEAQKFNKALESSFEKEMDAYDMRVENNQLKEKLDRLESYLGLPFLQMPEDEKQHLLRIIKE